LPSAGVALVSYYSNCLPFGEEQRVKEDIAAITLIDVNRLYVTLFGTNLTVAFLPVEDKEQPTSEELKKDFEILWEDDAFAGQNISWYDCIGQAGELNRGAFGAMGGEYNGWAISIPLMVAVLGGSCLCCLIWHKTDVKHNAEVGAAKAMALERMMTSKMGDGMHAMSDVLHDGLDKVGDTMHHLKDEMGDTMHKLTDGVGGTVHKLTDGVGGTMHKLTDGVGGTMHKLTDGVGGTMHKLTDNKLGKLNKLGSSLHGTDHATEVELAEMPAVNTSSSSEKKTQQETDTAPKLKKARRGSLKEVLFGPRQSTKIVPLSSTSTEDSDIKDLPMLAASVPPPSLGEAKSPTAAPRSSVTFHRPSSRAGSKNPSQASSPVNSPPSVARKRAMTAPQEEDEVALAAEEAASSATSGKVEAATEGGVAPKEGGEDTQSSFLLQQEQKLKSKLHEFGGGHVDDEDGDDDVENENRPSAFDPNSLAHQVPFLLNQQAMLQKQHVDYEPTSDLDDSEDEDDE
jgi:hypothetical protein